MIDDYRLTAIRKAGKIPKGLDAFVSQVQGAYKGRQGIMRRLLSEALDIDKRSPQHSAKTGPQLRQELMAMREQFRRSGRSSEAQIPLAMELIQESVHRTMGFRPFPVQIAGAIALLRGFIAEMSTGEGKTVTIAMAAIVRGWSGLPCHVITANDYLAARDAESLGPLFEFCHVSVGSVTGDMKPEERRRGYHRDITYTTAKDVLADFLRDRIALGKDQEFARRNLHAILGKTSHSQSQVVMRGLHTAMVDEADNVLIDEAVTPLIISREEPNEAFQESCRAAMRLSATLQEGRDYRVDRSYQSVVFLRDIEDILLEHLPQSNNIFNGIMFQKGLVRQALVAKEFFHLNKQYVIEDEKIVIVDESTGRKMPMRSWSSGLHQLVEAKEGLPLTPLKETQARLSFQRFFRFYTRFSGMTGTGREAWKEFWVVYGVPVITIPNHRKSRRRVNSLRVFSTQAAKEAAILKEIVQLHTQGRSVLVGTRNVLKSEEFASHILQHGIDSEVVNAVRQEQEAEIISRAGRKGAVTVATNMAGRGTDIKIDRSVNELGGLHVIATECHSSGRIDRQLFGRSARQGDNGSATPYTSLEDDLLTRNIPAWLLRLCKGIFTALPGTPHILGPWIVRLAQYMAHRKDYQSRLSVQRTDTWLDDALSFASDNV